MCSKKNVITKVYEALLKDKKTFEKLKNELSQKAQLDEAFICKHILPLAKKVDPSITWQDILAYEKEAITQPVKISLTDLEGVSGGKASNVLLSCGLLALMGFSGLATSNIASAKFIKFTDTKEYKDYKSYIDLKKKDAPSEDEKNAIIDGDKKYEFVTLGEVPFYLQADHLVDGLLWFRSPDEDKAFFVMDRKFENKNAVYTYSADSPSQLNTTKPSFKDIQSQEFKLFNINELTGYLQESFLDAKTKSFENPQTIQLADDNPLYNFSRFYNKDFKFDADSDKNLNRKETDWIRAATRANVGKNPMHSSSTKNGFSPVTWTKKLSTDSKKLELAKKLSSTLKGNFYWKIFHRTPSKKESTFNIIESSKILKEQYQKEARSTQAVDREILRNDGFIFFTLSIGEGSPPRPPSLLNEKEISETYLPFDKIPLVSCSKDLLGSVYKKNKKAPFPCFNGTSEEVKDQVTIYYINKLYDSLGNQDDFNEENLATHIDEIKKMIHEDELEVRIPTHVAVDKWEKVELE